MRHRDGGHRSIHRGTDDGPGPAAQALPAGALRLLRHLGRPNAFAVRDAFSADRLALYRGREIKGRHSDTPSPTLGCGTVPWSDSELLLTRGLVGWDGSRNPRLIITPAGHRLLKQTAPGDDGFGRQHRQIEAASIDGAAVTINAAESPLLWLHRRKGADGRPLIGAAAFAAGERLRADITLAGTLPRVTSNWSSDVAQGRRGPGDAMLNASEAMLAARQRVDAACRAVGPEFAGLLVDVCAFLKRLDEVERERGWPARSGKVVLGLALERLAAHYGLSETAVGRPVRRQRVWRAEDARPSMGPASADANASAAALPA